MWVSYPRVLISCSATWPEVHLQGKKPQISLAIILCLPAHPSFFLRASAAFRHSLRTSARQEEEWPGPVGHRNPSKSVLKTLSLAEYKILVVVFSNPVFFIHPDRCLVQRSSSPRVPEYLSHGLPPALAVHPSEQQFSSRTSGKIPVPVVASDGNILCLLTLKIS